MPDSSDDVKNLTEQVHKLNELIDALKKLGAPVEELEKYTNRLQLALDTGGDAAQAAADASATLAAYNNAVLKACGDDDDGAVCQAKFMHSWQARNVDFTLSIKNKKSATWNFIRATLRRHIPQAICDRLDSCKAQN
jgi:hypothetical protein